MSDLPTPGTSIVLNLLLVLGGLGSGVPSLFARTEDLENEAARPVSPGRESEQPTSAKETASRNQAVWCLGSRCNVVEGGFVPGCRRRFR